MRKLIGPGLAALAIVTTGLVGPARAEGVCVSLPNPTTCVDPTGTCLVYHDPGVGPAYCLVNPLG